MNEESKKEMKEGVDFLAGKIKLQDLQEFTPLDDTLSTGYEIERHISALEDWGWLESYTPCDILPDNFLNLVNSYKNKRVDHRLITTIRLNSGSDINRKCISDYFRICAQRIEQSDNIVETKFEGELGDSLIYARHDFSVMIDSDWKYNALDVMSNEIWNGSVPIDRTGTLPTAGLKTSPATPIPQIPNNFSKSVEEICDEEALRLWETGKRIDVFWSGGIDSTAVLVAFLRTMPTDGVGRIKVVCDELSYKEYPLFFEKFILNKLSYYINDMSHLPSWEKLFQNEYNALYTHNFYNWISNYINLAPDDTLFVGGQCADMIWRCQYGIPGFLKSHSSNRWRQFPRQGLGHFQCIEFDTKPEDYLSNDKFKPFIDEIETFNKACPIPIKNVNDMLWWWQFNLGWTHSQLETMTNVRYSSQVKRMRAFFNTDDFQLWGLLNPDKRGYKKKCLRDYIYSFAKDEEYRDIKEKEGSLSIRLGNVLGIDNLNNPIYFGSTSTDKRKMLNKYGDMIYKFREL